MIYFLRTLLAIMFGKKEPETKKETWPVFLRQYRDKYELHGIDGADKVIVARTTIVDRETEICSCLCDFDMYNNTNKPVPLIPTTCTIATMPAACKFYGLKRCV